MRLTVGELKEAIADLPDNMEIVMQGDDEGNFYNNMFCVETECVLLDESILGECILSECEGEDLDGLGLTQEEWNEAPRVVVLVPGGRV